MGFEPTKTRLTASLALNATPPPERFPLASYSPERDSCHLSAAALCDRVQLDWELTRLPGLRRTERSPARIQ